MHNEGGVKPTGNMHESAQCVWIVEDDPETRSSFAALVKSLGLTPAAFGSAAEILPRLAEDIRGCAIVDFRLPDTDGLELFREMRHRGCDIPVILISAFLDVRRTADAMGAGVFRVLEKPYRDSELSEAIHEAIDHDRTTRTKRTLRIDFAHRLESLDGRERAALDLIISGCPNKTVERKLVVSTRTVDRIRASILEKMRYLSFVELAVAYGSAKEAGLSLDQHPAVDFQPDPTS
jgi:FixJ family two-component response regulator